MKITIFDNISTIKNGEEMDIVEYLELTRDGEWMDITLDCRNIKDPEQQKAFKRTMPTATLSGTFEVRRDSGLIRHSEILAIDLDDVPELITVKKRLKNDKLVYACWVSTGGQGLRVLFKIDPHKHSESFAGIVEYLFDEHGITCVDMNGKNVSKPYIVSWDPDLYISPNDVHVFRRYVRETIVKAPADFVHTTNDFESILTQITGRHVQIYESYQDWLKIGFAFAEEFGEGGRQFFHDISCYWPKYNHRETDRQFTYCLRAKGTTVAHISTFYYLAQKHGINIHSEHTKKILRATRNGRKVGLTTDQIIKNLEKTDGITGADKLVTQIYDAHVNYPDKEEQSILYELEMYISNNFSLKMNEVTGFLEQNGSPLSPSDLNTIFIAAKKVVPKLDYQLMMRLLKSDYIESYNPFFQFFGSDGIAVQLPATPVPNKDFESPLIDKLASCIENKYPAYTVFFLRKWLVSTVSAAHKVHSPLLLALVGAQNSGKTEFFRRLPPPELKEFYAESKLDKGKDDELLMTQFLWIMDDELGGKSKVEHSKLKNLTSTQFYYLRRPYGDHNEKILRLAILCGTSNSKEVLTDPTGNRRIIPIDVENINKELYNSINKRDLFLEAFKLYKMGFDWRITHLDIPYLNKNQEEYTVTTKENELIQLYFEKGDEAKLTTTEIQVELENLTNQKLSIVALGQQLVKLGYVRKTARVGDSTLKKWSCKKINRFDNGSQPNNF